MTKKQNKPKAVQVKPAKKKTMVEEIAELKARVKALEDETGIVGPAGARGEKGDTGARGEQGDAGAAGAGFWGKAEVK